MAPATHTTVRAKFTITSVESHNGSISGQAEPAVLSNVTLQPVYDPDPTSENGRFYAATPGGSLQLFGLQPAIGAFFVVGALYYLDLTRADLPAVVVDDGAVDGPSSANDKVAALVPDAAAEHIDAAIQAFDKVALNGADHDEQKGAAVMAAMQAGASDVQAHAIAAAIPVLTLGKPSETDPTSAGDVTATEAPTTDPASAPDAAPSA